MSTVDRTEKKEAVAALHDVFSKTSVVVVAHYSGLTVAQMQRLRKQMRQAGAKVQVAKNSLAQIALEGTDVASIGPLLKGPTLIAHSIDPVAAAKAAVAFAKDHEKFVLLGGAMGKTALDVDGVKALATLPSLDELRAKLLGLLMAPATKLAQLAPAPAPNPPRGGGGGLCRQSRRLTQALHKPSVRTTYRTSINGQSRKNRRRTLEPHGPGGRRARQTA